MKDNSVFRSLSFIEARIQEKLTVAEIADSAYFSKYHYQRLFRDIVGKSVMEYVTKRKLTLAGRELLETQATVLDIALRFGYDSHEGFLRAFKAYMGVTPSEYRKYGLTAISLITGRERDTMTYSNSTDEILRELNGFVVKAKETAAAARKCELCWYKGFWDGIADRTDEFAAKLDVILTRVAAIAGRPDEITNRFTIIKAVEDIAFLSNVMALHVGLTAARGRPEDAKAMQPLCGRYRELAALSELKAQKICRFLLELAGLIFADMRKTAAEKLQTAIRKGREAIAPITGYDYIKGELEHLVRALEELPPDDMTAHWLEECLFRLKIISFTENTDILRSGGADKAMFEGIAPFAESVEEAREFFRTLPSPETPPEHTETKFMEDITYTGNVLLFYTRGEHEKMREIPGRLGVDTALSERAVQNFITLARKAVPAPTTYGEIAGAILSAYAALVDEAEKLAEHGGAIRFLAAECMGMAERVKRLTV